MISISHQRPLFILSGLTILLVGVVSLAGILHPQIYLPFTPESLLPGALSQDIVSLLAAVALLGCMWAIQRGSQRAWLVWTGFNGYLFYAYALYAFERVYNPFYLVYIALASLTLYSIIFIFVWADRGVLAVIDQHRLPQSMIAVYLLFLVAMFGIVWMSLILPAIGSQIPPDAASIFVMDLAFFLPLLVIVAVLLLRKRPSGALLSPIVLVKIGTLGCSVLLGTLLAPFFGQPVDPASIGIYAILGLGSCALALVALNRIKLPASAHPQLQAGSQ